MIPAPPQPFLGTMPSPTRTVRSRPIFIQGMWRTGSTYIWKKFRDQRQYRAYYEPLSEWLSKPRQTLLAVQPPGVTTNLRHPAIEDFYFAEFPFAPGGGVEHFEKALSYERYCLEESAEDEPLRRYVSNLISHAGRHGQTAVLQFNRGLLRAGWLSRNFSPVTILLLRHPAQTWKSMLSFEDHSFTGAFCILLGQNRFRAPLNRLPAWLDLPCRSGATIEHDQRDYTNSRIENEARLYPSFFDLFLAATLHCVRYADCILDMDAISSDVAVRRAAAARLRHLGISIDLECCAMPSAPLDSPAEREWLAYEKFAIPFLRSTLPASFAIPGELLASHWPTLGPYFRDLLRDFADRPEPAFVTEPVRAAARAVRIHQEGLGLFQQSDYETAAGKFGQSLAEEASADRWNDWATAQNACLRSLLGELGYRQALRMDPQHQDAIGNLGLLLAAQNRDAQALPLLVEAQRNASVHARAALARLASSIRARLGASTPVVLPDSAPTSWPG